MVLLSVRCGSILQIQSVLHPAAMSSQTHLQRRFAEVSGHYKTNVDLRFLPLFGIQGSWRSCLGFKAVLGFCGVAQSSARRGTRGNSSFKEILVDGARRIECNNVRVIWVQESNECDSGAFFFSYCYYWGFNGKFRGIQGGTPL